MLISLNYSTQLLAHCRMQTIAQIHRNAPTIARSATSSIDCIERKKLFICVRKLSIDTGSRANDRTNIQIPRTLELPYWGMHLDWERLSQRACYAVNWLVWFDLKKTNKMCATKWWCVREWEERPTWTKRHCPTKNRSNKLQRCLESLIVRSTESNCLCLLFVLRWAFVMYISCTHTQWMCQNTGFTNGNTCTVWFAYCHQQTNAIENINNNNQINNKSWQTRMLLFFLSCPEMSLLIAENIGMRENFHDFLFRCFARSASNSLFVRMPQILFLFHAQFICFFGCFHIFPEL